MISTWQESCFSTDELEEIHHLSYTKRALNFPRLKVGRKPRACDVGMYMHAECAASWEAVSERPTDLLLRRRAVGVGLNGESDRHPVVPVERVTHGGLATSL